MSRHQLSGYTEYKSSGIVWLEQIPKHWEIERAKSLFKKMSRAVSESDEIVTAFRDGQVTLRNNRRTEGFTNAILEHGYQGVKVSDLVIHAMDGFAGAIGVSDSNGKSSPVYQVYTPRKSERIYTPYFGLLVRQMAILGFVASLGKGIRERSSEFRHKEFAPLSFPVPPIEEQIAIANYIHKKTSDIDKQIDLLEQKTEKYANLKQSIINETVTRGLDKTALMKESGVEWIGYIPVHWEIKRLKDIAKSSKEKNGNTPIGEMLSVSGIRGIVVKEYDDEIKMRTIEELTEYRVVRVGQLVVNTMWLNFRGIGVSQVRGYVSPAYRAYFLNKKVFGSYLHYLMRSNLYVSGYSRYLQGIRPNSLQMKTIDFESLPIVLPTIEEQKTIAEYLDTKTAYIEKIIETIRLEIEKLKELRKTLINDMVTGKIRVWEGDGSRG